MQIQLKKSAERALPKYSVRGHDEQPDPEKKNPTIDLPALRYDGQSHTDRRKRRIKKIKLQGKKKENGHSAKLPPAGPGDKVIRHRRLFPPAVKLQLRGHCHRCSDSPMDSAQCFRVDTTHQSKPPAIRRIVF